MKDNTQPPSEQGHDRLSGNLASLMGAASPLNPDKGQVMFGMPLYPWRFTSRLVPKKAPNLARPTGNRVVNENAGGALLRLR